MPVRLPPGRLRLVTSPAFRGSSMNATIGIVLVAAVKGHHDGIGPGDDHIRAAAHDLPSQIAITLVIPLGGIPFDDQIFSLDVAQAAELGENRISR
jgi:hypothetical protein